MKPWENHLNLVIQHRFHSASYLLLKTVYISCASDNIIRPHGNPIKIGEEKKNPTPLMRSKTDAEL